MIESNNYPCPYCGVAEGELHLKDCKALLRDVEIVQNEMKTFLQFVQDFSRVRRWSQIHCSREESSLEHTAAVALMALKIADDCPYEVNVARLLVKALLHDMEEAITGDIMTPVKYHSPEITKAMKEFEAEAAEEISDKVWNGDWALEMWHTAKDGTVEGQIVKIADKAASVYKSKQELQLGNTSFLQYEENIWNALHEIKINLPKHLKELETYIHQLMDYLQEKVDG